MNDIRSISSTVDFEPRSIHWKGTEYHFFVRVLSAVVARKIRQSIFDKNSISMTKAQERPEHLVSACIYVPKGENDTREHVDFCDDDGQYHELVRAWTKKEVESMKEPLLVKLAEVCDEVNKTKLNDEEKEELGNA